MRRAAVVAALAVFAWTAGTARAGDETVKDPSFLPGKPNRASIRLEYENFDADRSPWGLATFEYTRKVNRASLIGRINQAHRFGENDTQFEFDAYPKLWRKAYAYLNIGRASSGAANDLLFPDWRYGAELFQGLPASFEVSFGARYLDFPSSHATIWTGSVAYYWKDWWFSLRPYHSRSRKDDGTTVTEGNSTSANFTARWYFGRPLEYMELVAGKGSGVDAGDVTNVGRLDEWVVQADVRKLLGSRWMIRGGVGYRAGENNSGEMRHSIVLRIGADVFF